MIRVSLLMLCVACKPVAPQPATPTGTVVQAPGVGPVVVPNDLSAPLPLDPRVRIGTLDNGLTYYLESNQRPAARAELRLAVKAGSVLEDEDQLGMAHFLEHMAFQGTQLFPGNDIISYLESLGMRFGAHLNAYTTFDETVYALQLPTDDPAALESGFLMLSEWADRVTFDPVECEKERGVVLEEWRLREGLGQRIQDAMLPYVFHDSRYLVRQPIGTPESLQTFHCDAAVRFYDSWYRPELMAVMAVGDFDLDVVEDHVVRWFDGMQNPRRSPERTWYRVPDHDELFVTVLADPELPQGGVNVFHKIDEVEGQDHLAYRRFLLEQMLFVMLNERLAILASDPAAPWLGAGGNESALGHLRSAHVLQMVPKEGRELEALELALVELERVRRHGFTAGELQRAQAEMALNLQTYFDERDKTESSTHVEELLRVFLTDEPMPGIPYEWAMAQLYLPEITLEEANNHAHTDWFGDRSRVVQLVLPLKPGLAVPEEAAVRAVVDGVRNLDIGPPAVEADDVPLMDELPTPGTAERIATDAELGTSTWKLSNGVTVVLKPTAFQADEIMFEAFRPGGASMVGVDDIIPAITAVELALRSGVGEHDLIALSRMRAGRDARVMPALERTRDRWTGRATQRDLELMFQMLHLAVTAPRFEASALDMVRQTRTEALRNRESVPDALFEDAWTDLVWGGDPRQTNWTSADIEALDLARSEEIYRDRFGDVGGATFVFVGSFDEATLIGLLERYVASLPADPGPHRWTDDGSRKVDGVHVAELPRGQTPRGKVRLMFHGPFDPTWRARRELRAVASVLETWLFEELREELGGTYGVVARDRWTQDPVGTYEIVVEFECDPMRLDELLAATWTMVERTRTEPVYRGAIDTMLEKDRRGRETSMRTNSFWVNSLSSAISRGEDPRDILAFDARNAELSAVRVRDRARELLDASRYVQMVQRP